MPSSSAAIRLIEARLPPMSGVPTDSTAVPSPFRFRLTQVWPPKLNQKPEATPRPWFSFNGTL
ncbi:hypothetical protein D3C83_218320 [compost metagenome]